MATVTSKAWHHPASTLVVEARKIIEDSYGVEPAITKLNAAYSIAEKIIPELDRESNIPLNVTVQLVNLLETPEFQCDYNLLYTIAKTCRIFMDLTFVLAVKTHTTIRPDTHKALKEKLEKVLKAVPEKKVAIRYELSCCWATSLVLNDAVEYLKQFLIDHGGNIITAIVKQSPGDLVAPLKQALMDLWNLTETYWFNDVLSLHLCGKTELLKLDFNSSTDFKPVYDAVSNRTNKKLSIRTYKRANITAHCVLALLREGMMKSIEAKNPGLQAKLLRGEDSDTAPGFRDLAEYGIGESLDRFNSSWSVRCETIRFLFNMFQEKSLEENVWQFMLFIIATKLTNRKEHKEEHKLVSSFLRYILGEMKSQYSRKESRPRINHFLGEVKGKIKLEKGVSEALDSLRRKKESLRTILTDQTEELGNKEKDLAQIPAIVPGQQKAGTNESTEEKKAREDREKLEKEIQSLKTTIDQQATSLEDTQAQEELLSLLQLEGTPTHD